MGMEIVGGGRCGFSAEGGYKFVMCMKELIWAVFGRMFFSVV